MAVIFVAALFVMLIGMLVNTEGFFDEFLLAYRTTVPTGAPYDERIEGAIDAVESTVDEGTYHRQDFIELYGLAQKLQGKNVITDVNYGSLYLTKSGQTTFTVPERDLSYATQATYDLANRLIADGHQFLYIQLPFKIAPDSYDGSLQLPENIKDYTNQNAEQFLYNLNTAGINTYDVRDQFWSSGWTQQQLFFNTDHHWTIQAAFMATGFIADYLNQNYNLGIPEGLYTEENFNFTTYEDDYIGSMGRRVGKIYGGTDDFTLITPKFDTDYTVHTYEGLNDTVTEGTFEEAILDWDYLNDPDITTNRYAIYHGDFQELRFINNLAQNDSKVLIIKDSFGIPVYSFLSLGIKEVRAIDLRIFCSNVAEYVNSYDPDLVILMYNADSFTSPMFDFNLDREWE